MELYLLDFFPYTSSVIFEKFKKEQVFDSRFLRIVSEISAKSQPI